MSKLAASIALARADFAQDLRLRGFVAASPYELTGSVATGTREYAVRIELWNDFPFGPPHVFPPDDFPASWHLQRGTGMCLYHGDDLSGLPWLDTDEFLALLVRWFTESENGWQGDFPLLDRDVYIPRSEDEQRLIIYPDLHGATWVRCLESKRCIVVEGRKSRPRGSAKPKSKKKSFGYVVSIGEPPVPFSDWEGLAPLLGEQLDATMQAIREYRVEILLVRYTRGDIEGVLALKVACDAEGVISIRSLPSASASPKALTLRAGRTAADLREKTVGVVGLGAVGSYVADSLARNGVGSLFVADYDVIKPGNLIRHAAQSRHIGWNKAFAIKELVEARAYNTTTVCPAPVPLSLYRDAEFLLNICDLVVDATADGKATALLHHAAEAAGKHVVSVCLKEDGQVVRVDILPPLAGSALPETPERRREPGSYVYDAGCGDPVSMTPHAAVMEAAAVATRQAIGLMTGSPLHPAGEVRDYR